MTSKPIDIFRLPFRIEEHLKSALSKQGEEITVPEPNTDITTEEPFTDTLHPYNPILSEMTFDD